MVRLQHDAVVDRHQPLADRFLHVTPGRGEHARENAVQAQGCHCVPAGLDFVVRRPQIRQRPDLAGKGGTACLNVVLQQKVRHIGRDQEIRAVRMHEDIPGDGTFNAQSQQGTQVIPVRQSGRALGQAGPQHADGPVLRDLFQPVRQEDQHAALGVRVAAEKRPVRMRAFQHRLFRHGEEAGVRQDILIVPLAGFVFRLRQQQFFVFLHYRSTRSPSL